MELIFIAAYIAVCSAAKLDRAYLPPASAKTAGGSPGSLQTPFAGNSFNQGLGGLPKGSYTNDFQGVVVDAASAGTRASGPGESGLGLPRTVYGSADSKVGEAAFRSTPVAGFRQLPGSGQTHSSSHNDQGPERPQAAQERASNTLRFNSEVGPESFNYAFETDNGIIAEENGVENNGVQAQGAYAYKGDDGQVYSVTYTADEGGYQPKGDHLPTPPPIPEEILRSLEQNAKEEAAGIVDDGSYDAQKYNAGGDYAENDNSGQYNGKVDQSGNRHSDATASGSFISQSNVGRPNSFAASAAHSGFHDKSASASASVNDGNKSIKDYLPPSQQNRPEQSSTGFINGGSTNGNFRPLSSTNKHRSQSSAFASSQPSIGSQISGFGHQQLTNVEPNQPSQTGFEGEDHSSLSSNIAPSTPLGSSQSDLNSHGSVSNNGPQFHSQFQSSSNQRYSMSTNGPPQFNINGQNQRESTRAQSASSFASLDSQAPTPQLTNSSPRFNGNNRAHGTQAPTQSASSFASFNSQASSPGHISSTRFHSQPTNGNPQFNGNSRGQDVPVPTQSASSFASFNSQPSTPSQTSFQSQLTNGRPQINGNNRGQSGQASTQSSFASFKSEAFPGQLSSDSTKNNIHGSQFSRQDQNKQFGSISEIQNKIPESAQSAFTGLNSQSDTSSAHSETSKFPGSSFNSQNFDSSTQYGTQGSSFNHNVGTKKPTDDGNLQLQFDSQSQSSVKNKPGQLSAFSSAPFNSQISSSPNSNLQFGFNQKNTAPFNQLQGQNHDDTRSSPSTSRPDFSQSHGQDDSYYYNQPSQPFKTPSVHGSPLSASSNAQFSNTVHGSQIQSHSKQPSSVTLTSPNQIAGQNQNNYNGITQATASSFTPSLPTTATSFNVQPSNQFGMKTTSSQINRRPQPIQSGINTFGSQTTKSQNTPENVNHNSQTNSFQSESSNVPLGNINSGDSSFGQSTSQQYNGEIYEYNKPAQTLPAPSNPDLSSGQFGQKDQSSKSISQSAIEPQVANKFDTQEAASHLTSFGQPVSGSSFGKHGNNAQPIQTQFNIQSTNQGTRGSKPFGVQIPQDPCCQGSRASAQASFGSKPIQSNGNSQFNNAGRPSQDSGQQSHLSAQNLGNLGSPQSFKPGQFSNQKQGTGQFGSQSATAQSFHSGQSVAGKGEVFGGPRKPPSFDADSGYHY